MGGTKRGTMALTVDEVALEVTPLSASIGAEIRGVDISTPLEAPVIAAIRQVWLDRKVVFFPGQHLDPASHVAFAGQFGETTRAHPVLPGLDGQPEVFEIDYGAIGRLQELYGKVATPKRGIDWHTDVTYVERPPMGSVLNAVVIPPAGGDTMFSDQQAAYEALSAPMQQFLGTLRAVHDGRAQFGKALAKRQAGGDEGEWEGEKVTTLGPIEHPVVRTHPETGVRTLFVNPGFTSHLVGLHRAESQALLAFLYAHSVKPEFTMRYHWHAGDVGMWDNRATQHSVIGDYGEQDRVIQRVTLRGDAPV